MPPRTKQPENELADHPLLEIRRSGIHGYGVFARATIKRGVRLIEYVGEKITKKEAERRAYRQMARSDKHGDGAVYIFDLNSRYDIDGNVAWNPARRINHSCDPNCRIYDENGRLWIYSGKALAAGEELSYNYGYELEAYEDHPCRCGVGSCVGYIVRRDQWRRLKKLLAAA
jgi:SET domain-containing protein